LFSFLVFVLIAHVVGYGLLRFSKMVSFSKETPWKNSFLSLVTGISFSVGVVAIFKTSGLTIYWLLAFPFLFGLWKRTGLSCRVSIKSVIIPAGLVIGTVFWGLQFLLFGPLSGEVFLPPDVRIYAGHMYYLNQGYENLLSVLNVTPLVDSAALVPYHYFEMWLGVAIWQMTPWVGLGNCLLFVAYPVSFFAVFLGVMAFLECKGWSKAYWTIFIFPLLAFIGPIYSSSLIDWFNEVPFLGRNVIIYENFGFFRNTVLYAFHAQKHLPFVMFFLLGIIAWERKGWRYAFAVFAIVPIVNTALTPAIGFALATMIIWKAIVTGRYIYYFRTGIVYIIPVTVMTILYIVYSPQLPNGASEKLLYTGSEDLNSKGEVLRAIMRFSLGGFWVILIYLPVLLALWVAKIHRLTGKTFTYLCFVGLLALGGLLTRPFVASFNSGQLITYALPAFNVFAFCLLFAAVFGSMQLKFWRRLVSGLLVGVVLIANVIDVVKLNFKARKYVANAYSGAYLSAVNEEINREPDAIIGYRLSTENVALIHPGLWYYSPMPGEFLSLRNSYRVLSLNYPYFTYKHMGSNHFFTPFNHMQYVMPADSISISMFEERIPKMIDFFNVRFVIMAADTMPSWLMERSTKIIRDEKSGELFVVLSEI